MDLTSQLISLSDDLRELAALRDEVATLRSEVAGLRHERDLFYAIGGAPDDEYEVVVFSRMEADGDAGWKAYELVSWPWGHVIATEDDWRNRLRGLAERALAYHWQEKRAKVTAENSQPLFKQVEWVQTQAAQEWEQHQQEGEAGDD